MMAGDRGRLAICGTQRGVVVWNIGYKSLIVYGLIRLRAGAKFGILNAVVYGWFPAS